MNTLPASVEAYLSEAGFSSTEILVLKRLLEDDALTLRQLAAKTGKSTGVLDQATKKLLRKNIVSKEWINDSFKFTLHSLQSVVQWMSKDTKEKREMLLRRHQNFETFISTIEYDKKRPEMQYYEGYEGFQQAYMQLLDNGKEMLHYMPVTCSIEDDPLRDFRVEYFRERRRKGIFSKVIAQNTTRGRRFQSRDPFEYRQSILVDEEQYPFSFEKIIIGDTVACFNHAEKRACLIRYPELAAHERDIFDGIWKQHLASKSTPQVSTCNSSSPEPSLPSDVPLKVRTLSRIREFFLSKESLITFAIFMGISGLTTFAIYRSDAYLNLLRLREKVTSIAAAGALQFDAKDLDQLHTSEDMLKPEYAKVIKQLDDIRYQNQWVKYMYILRPTGQENQFEFVADADSADPSQKKDYNGDGKINKAEGDITPGKKYNVSKTDVLANGHYEKPTANKIAYTDPGGTFISGYSPIRDSSDHINALLGVDIFTSQLQDLAVGPFTVLALFFGLFFLFVFVRLAAFNRSLSSQIRETNWITHAAFISLFVISVLGFYLATIP